MLEKLIDAWNSGSPKKKEEAREKLLVDTREIFFEGKSGLLDRELCLEGEEYWNATGDRPIGGRTFAQITAPKKERTIRACPATGKALFAGKATDGNTVLDWTTISEETQKFVAFTRDRDAAYPQSYTTDEAAELLYVIGHNGPFNHKWKANRDKWEALQRRLAEGKANAADMGVVERVQERLVFKRPTVGPGLVGTILPADISEMEGARGNPCADCGADQADHNQRHGYTPTWKRPGMRFFVACSEVDQAASVSLRQHLRSYEQRGEMTVITSADCLPGKTVDMWTQIVLDSADALALIISPSFLISPLHTQCVGVALEQRRVVLPVLYRPCLPGEPFNRLPGVPNKPITTWKDQDEAWVEVARKIGEVAKCSRR